MGSACDGRRWNCARGTREEDFAAFLALYWCLVEFPLQVRMGKAHEMMPSPVRRFSLVTRLRGAPESTNLSVPQLQHPRRAAELRSQPLQQQLLPSPVTGAVGDASRPAAGHAEGQRGGTPALRSHCGTGCPKGPLVFSDSTVT
nr:uncharacterized protein LOC110362310 isoform X3 [Columba livia]XP_021149704.1 uncharacterized protein LOC110362310 isoform X3 [Columba livia]